MAEERKTTYKTRLVKERVDEETGEILRQAVETEYVPGFVDVKLPKRKHLGNGDFLVIFQNTMLRIERKPS